MTKKEQERVKKIAQDLEKLFKNFNREVCSKCPEIKFPKNGRGCCSNCAGSNSGGGYFYFSIDNKRKERNQLNRLKKKFGFTPTYGFFNNRQKKCRLPRTKRSVKCQSFCCNDKMALVASTLTEKLEKIRTRNGLII